MRPLERHGKYREIALIFIAEKKIERERGGGRGEMKSEAN